MTYSENGLCHREIVPVITSSEERRGTASDTSRMEFTKHDGQQPHGWQFTHHISQQKSAGKPLIMYGNPDKRPRLLIADDHALLAEGLARILSHDYEVLGICDNGRQLVAHALEKQPDLIVLDIAMPELNGLEAASQLRDLLPKSRLVFVTQTVDPYYARAAFRAGGMAYVAKQSGPDELLTALRRALIGRPYLTPLLKDVMPQVSFGELRNASTGMDRELTPRQRQVLQLVAEGRTVKEISAALNISPKTVEFHKNALMNETGLRTTADLTRYAIARGVISGSPHRLPGQPMFSRPAAERSATAARSQSPTPN